MQRFARTSSPFLITEYLPTALVLFISWHLCKSAVFWTVTLRRICDYTGRRQLHCSHSVSLEPCIHRLPFACICLLCWGNCSGLHILLKPRSTYPLSLTLLSNSAYERNGKYCSCLRLKNHIRGVAYSELLRAGRSGYRIAVGARLSAPVQTGSGTNPASCKMGSGSLSRG